MILLLLPDYGQLKRKDNSFGTLSMSVFFVTVDYVDFNTDLLTINNGNYYQCKIMKNVLPIY